MVLLHQGESLSFYLTGNDYSGFEINAALRPISIRQNRILCRDNSLTEELPIWNNIGTKSVWVTDHTERIAVWSLSPTQTGKLPFGKYAMEVSLSRDGVVLKVQTISIINIVKSFINRV